jgi:hypothetical protein
MILKFCIFTQLELNYRYITSHDFEILISFVVELFIYLLKKKKKTWTFRFHKSSLVIVRTQKILISLLEFFSLTIISYYKLIICNYFSIILNSVSYDVTCSTIIPAPVKPEIQI